MKKQQIKIYLDPELMAWIREQAKLKHCSIAQIVRNLIVEAMGR